MESSIFFGVFISLGAYGIGLWLRRKTGSALANPLLVSIILVCAFLLLTGTSYETYCEGSQFISYLLTPATVCLAVPLYEQFQLLRRNPRAIMAGIVAGTLASLSSVLLLSLVARVSHESYVTLLPKSIATAIGLGVSEQLGGIVPVTVVSIVITGVLGNVFAEQFLRLIRVHHPIARGIAIGTATHAVGTARAMEMGQIEGAMSVLSTVVAGLLTVILAPLFAAVSF